MKYISIILLLVAPSLSYSLSLEEYLNEVHSNNFQYSSALMMKEAALKSSSAQSSLVTDVYLTIQDTFNMNLQNPALQGTGTKYDKYRYNQLTASLTNNSSIGLQTTISYTLQAGKYVNSSTPGDTFGTSTKFYSAQPSLTLVQSLWQNSFGSGTRAKIRQIEYAGLAQYYEAQNTINQIDTQAKTAYWNLVIGKKKIEAKEENLKAVQSVYDYMNRRAQMLLSQNSDVAQEKASLENSKLALLTEKNNYITQLQSFNLLRNKPSMQEPEALDNINESYLLSYKPSQKRQKYKPDLLASKYNLLASVENYTNIKETAKPTLNLIGEISASGSSFDNAKNANNNATVSNSVGYVGFVFTVPLNPVSAYNAVASANSLSRSQSMAYEQLKLKQEDDWTMLTTQIAQTQSLLEQSGKIVAAQKNKLDIETARLQSGRTTTSQVLLFQVDYFTSRSNYNEIVSAMYSLLSQEQSYNVSDIGE